MWTNIRVVSHLLLYCLCMSLGVIFPLLHPTIAPRCLFKESHAITPRHASGWREELHAASPQPSASELAGQELRRSGNNRNPTRLRTTSSWLRQAHSMRLRAPSLHMERRFSAQAQPVTPTPSLLPTQCMRGKSLTTDCIDWQATPGCKSRQCLFSSFAEPLTPAFQMCMLNFHMVMTEQV